MIPAFFILAASYAGCNELLVVTLFMISIGAQGLMTVGTMLNPMDLSPVFASTLSGIMNCISTLTGIAAPYVVGVLTPNASHFYPIHTCFHHQSNVFVCIIQNGLSFPQSLLTEWRMVFWITFGVHISQAVIFLVWGSGRVQPWNSMDVKKDKETKPLELVE